MKTRTWIAASVIGSLLLWCSPPLEAQGARGHSVVALPGFGEFVGVTTAKVQPGTGHLGLARVCQAQFPRSHVCSSAEILATGSIPVLPETSGTAWINPSNVSIVNGPTGSGWNFAYVDASGVVVESDWWLDGALNCSSWWSSYSARKGLVIYFSGEYQGLSTMSCDSTLAVACCSDLTR